MAENVEMTPNREDDPIRLNSVTESLFECSRITRTPFSLKCLCVNSLTSRWSTTVNNVNSLIASNDPAYVYQIVTFLDLWQTIISVKANLSVNDTEPFCSNLDTYIHLLSQNTTPVIWKRILRLLNEVLCYGSTLALQDILAKPPCDLAASIVRNVKDVKNRNRNLLHVIPYRIRSLKFGSGDTILLKRLILLVLKSVAVTVKETRTESSSDSEREETDRNMVVIARNIKPVIDQLDSSVKQLLPFHPKANLAQWIVQVFADRDDYLIESMVCCLDVALGLSCRDKASVELRRKLNPTTVFVQFLHSVSFDANVLLYFLVSNETCFLLYLYRYLEYACKNWREFVNSCPNEIGRVITVLVNLEGLILDLVNRDVFPYNIYPVLDLLNSVLLGAI